MSVIVGEYAAVEAVYDEPTLQLLHRDTAPAVLALFRTVFSADEREIPLGRMHVHVENLFAELSQAGKPNVPKGTGAELCRQWVREHGWLKRDFNNSREEVYVLTASAQEALAFIERHTRDQVMLNQHRVTNLVTQARRLNLGTNPDKEVRLAILREQRERLDSEIAELERSVDLVALDEDFLLDGLTVLLRDVEELPAEFTRVTESFDRQIPEFLRARREEEATSGSVISGYLEFDSNLAATNPAGRAFEGAFELLGDEETLHKFRNDVAALLALPETQVLLRTEELAKLTAITATLTTGTRQVMNSRTRAHRVVADYLTSRNAVQDLELSGLLNQLETEMVEWAATCGPREQLDIDLFPDRLSLEYFKPKLFDPRSQMLPEPLDDPEPDIAVDPDAELAALLAAGGPTYAALHERLAQAARGGPVDVAALFNSLPERLRRPVEVFGLLSLGEDMVTEDNPAPGDGDPAGAGEEPDGVFVAIRPDGTRRHLRAPTRYRSQLTTAAERSEESP